MKLENKNITFIGGIFLPQNIDYFKYHSKGVFQYAADTMQKNIIRGLQDNLPEKLNIITVPFIGSFPDSCNLKYIENQVINQDKYFVSQIGFNNIKVINDFSKYQNLKKEIVQQFIVRKKPLDAIVIYGMFPYFLKIACFIKKKLPAVKICMIVPDLPHLMGGDNTKLHIKIYNRCIKRIINTNINYIDSFVFVSKYMEDYLKTSKPFEVLEGIYNLEEDKIVEDKETNPTILYSGTLALRYGIEELLQAFVLIKDPNIKLWICGAGNGEKIVQEYANRDKRITYKGQLDRSEVIRLQKKATVLINPRNDKEDFTKYSFPSKTIEYLGSGTATILYKLSGIPEEYYNYCFICEENDIEGLKNSIIEVLSKPKEVLKSMGESAKQFIVKNKNESTQSRKIITLINSL